MSTRPTTETTLRRDVARRVSVRRAWLDLSQTQLAEKAAVSRNFVSAIERGAQGLDVWRLWQVAEALGGTLPWLLAGPDEAVTAVAPGRPNSPVTGGRSSRGGENPCTGIPEEES
jgi:ribosome-binding protein aMBF1 (putative translation factor)